MDFIKSVDFFFTIKNLFLLSLINKTTFKPSRRLLQISVIFVISIIGILYWIGTFALHPKIKTDTQVTSNVSNYCLFTCQMLVWITSGFYRHRESHFFTELVSIDKILVKYGSLDEIYQKFSRATFTIILPMIANVSLGIFVWKDYLVAMDGPLFYVVFPFVVVSIIHITIFVYAFVFYLDVKLLRDRFRHIKQLSVTCSTMDAYEDLEKAHKSLIFLMDTVNDSFGVKLGFVLVSNFLGSITTSYNLFLSFILPGGNTLQTYFDMFGTLVPNLIMLFMSFLSGEWVAIDVKDSLHALTGVPIHTEEAIAVKRKLHLKMKAITFGLSGGKVIPLNLGILFAGFNILATYFVILLQFRTLTDDSILQEST